MSSYLEEAFAAWLNQHPDIPAPVREYQFDNPSSPVKTYPSPKPRLWRFDFAWLEQKVAVEIEGGLYRGGRHQSLEGFIKDAEKYEAALVQGWRVYRVPGPWVMQGDRWIWRAQVMETLKLLLKA